MPSFRPLSTFKACRIPPGTRSELITACASAASVGASIVAKMAACQNGSPTKMTAPTNTPATIVKGSPIPIRRIARWSPLHQNKRKSIREASENKTRMSVRLAIMLINVLSLSVTNPVTLLLRKNPNKTKTIGSVIIVF